LSFAAILIAVLLPEALPLQAQERQQDQQATQAAQEGRRVHTVRGGDTLWDLANFYLSDPFLWPEIYRLNTVVVEDPHWIYPTEELVLPGPGEVRAPVEPEPGEVRVPGEEEVVAEVPEMEVEGPPPELQGATSIFAAREITRQTLIYQPSPPLDPIAVTEWDFYRSAMLLRLSEIGPRGEVIEYAVPLNVPAKEADTPARYERIYVSHPDGEPPQAGDRFLLTRVEQQVKPYGYIVRPTGIATIAAVHEEVSTAVVVQVYDVIAPGNLAFELESFQLERGVFAEPVGTGPTGELVALLDAQFVPTIEDLGFINVGRTQGLEIGDEFEIFVPDRRSATGYKVPAEHVATGRVVRVTEQTATIRVIEQRHAAIAIGLPVRLVRKMPS
jgi:hypothetical protein